MIFNRRIFLKTAATGAAAVTISPNLVFSTNKLMNIEVVNPQRVYDKFHYAANLMRLTNSDQRLLF
jgi:hypothetical protein